MICWSNPEPENFFSVFRDSTPTHQDEVLEWWVLTIINYWWASFFNTMSYIIDFVRKKICLYITFRNSSTSNIFFSIFIMRFIDGFCHWFEQLKWSILCWFFMSIGENFSTWGTGKFCPHFLQKKCRWGI